jgi:hypothetical protein
MGFSFTFRAVGIPSDETHFNFPWMVQSIEQTPNIFHVGLNNGGEAV